MKVVPFSILLYFEMLKLLSSSLTRVGTIFSYRVLECSLKTNYIRILVLGNIPCWHVWYIVWSHHHQQNFVDMIWAWKATCFLVLHICEGIYQGFVCSFIHILIYVVHGMCTYNLCCQICKKRFSPVNKNLHTSTKMACICAKYGHEINNIVLLLQVTTFIAFEKKLDISHFLCAYDSHEYKYQSILR